MSQCFVVETPGRNTVLKVIFGSDRVLLGLLRAFALLPVVAVALSYTMLHREYQS